MFRRAARGRASRFLRLTDWIHKMLFLWSREPSTAISASPRAGPWFAWFATAVLLWRCRRRIVRAVLGPSSPLRLLKRRRASGATTVVVSKAHHHHQHHHPVRRHNAPSSAPASTGEHRRVYQHIKYHQNQNGSTNPGVQKPKQMPKPPAVLRRDVNAAVAAAAAKSRLKRLHAGDGPHITAATVAGRKLAVSASCVQISQQLYYRVTRSGRIYGKYPNRQHSPVK